MPQLDKNEFGVEVQNFGEQSQPIILTENEYMRRMKEISKFRS